MAGEIEQFNESELRDLYELIATASHAYPVDSESFHVLTKEMADIRGRM
jgi:hypothetical protein